ncbi:MAG: DUF58 domain-containing protein [Gammaproteobacteria bacterium]
MMSPVAWLRRKGRDWARRRQGIDRDQVVLTSRRIYILPTAQGIAFGAMIFLMLLGSMNYNNSIGLAVTFALTAFALVVMHHCHRNVSGLRLTLAPAAATFAGQNAQFPVILHNDAAHQRLDLGVFVDQRLIEIASLDAGTERPFMIPLPAARRGRLALPRVALRCRYPAGLFQAWAWLNTDLECIVYPKPAEHTEPAPEHEAQDGSRRDSVQGNSDFAGLREYRPGDPSRRIAWKAYARTNVLTIKTFSGADTAPHRLRFADTRGDIERRLSVLARWCLDAQETGQRFSLEIPSATVVTGSGRAHLNQCLRALALHR